MMMAGQFVEPDGWLTYAGTALAAAAALVLCLRALIRLRPRRRDGQAGVATIEFALVMPLVLFLILILMQVALLMAGQFFVHYAAFAATRAAIVQIPRDLSSFGGEPGNVIAASAGSEKLAAIARAAQFAVMPVCGRDESGGVNGRGFADALREHYTLLGEPTPRWVDTLAAERLAYAVEHTEVTLMEVLAHNPVESQQDYGTFELRPIAFGSYTYQPRDPVAVRVEHRLNLSVPYVRGIFADGYHRTKHGESAYADAAATYVLTLEGVSPQMPPEPLLPRRDRRRGGWW